MLITAPSGSGKSNVIQNLLWNDNFYKGYFDNVVFISPTIYEDKTAQHLFKIQETDEKLLLSDDIEHLDDIINNIVKSQHENNEENEHVLLVLEDCIGAIKATSTITNLIMRLRHYRISVIIVTQYYRAIPPKIRENCNAYLFFANNNQTEVDKIIEEIGSRFPDFKNKLTYATDEPYSFLFVKSSTKQLYKKFDELLYEWGKK
jgi:cobalamin biosynthesis Mg chelatase CobN